MIIILSVGPDGVKVVVRKKRKNMREKQRREEVAASFNALTALLNLQTPSKFKMNKVTVLTTAVAEIEALRSRVAAKEREVDALRAELAQRSRGASSGGGGGEGGGARMESRPALNRSLGSDEDMRAVIADLGAGM